MGFMKAAKYFKVLRLTLFRLYNEARDVGQMTKCRLRRKTIIPKELEDKLVEYIIMMDKKFFG